MRTEVISIQNLTYFCPKAKYYYINYYLHEYISVVFLAAAKKIQMSFFAIEIKFLIAEQLMEQERCQKKN